jgi:hypothetical protein
MVWILIISKLDSIDTESAVDVFELVQFDVFRALDLLVDFSQGDGSILGEHW